MSSPIFQLDDKLKIQDQKIELPSFNVNNNNPSFSINNVPAGGKETQKMVSVFNDAKFEEMYKEIEEEMAAGQF